MNLQLHEVDVVILCGGKGTRLYPLIPDLPKALAPFGNSTFLDILIDFLKRSGFRRFILCTGYMKDKIYNHVIKKNDISIVFSEETDPLGTGGALKNAQYLIQSNTFVVLNGDSICDLNFSDFFEFHVNQKAILSIVLSQKNDTRDFGSVITNELSEIINFNEKLTDNRPGLINTGIYLMEKEIFSLFPSERDHFSLETNFFPNILNTVRCVGFIIESDLIDIGTPERYEMAVHLLGGKNAY